MFSNMFPEWYIEGRGFLTGSQEACPTRLYAIARDRKFATFRLEFEDPAGSETLQ